MSILLLLCILLCWYWVMAPLRGAFLIPTGSSWIHLGRQGDIWVVRDTSGYLSNGRTVGRTDGRTVGIVFLTHIFAQVDAGSMIFESGVLFRVVSDRYRGRLCKRGKRYDRFCVYNDTTPSNTITVSPDRIRSGRINFGAYL